MSPRQLPWIVALLLSVVLVAFAWTGYPPPSTDAPGFLVSAINWELGRGLVNPLYSQVRLADPAGGERHVYNPPLFPLVVALLMPWPTPQGAFLAIALLRGVSLLITVWLFSRLLAACGGAWRWTDAALAGASLCGLATNWLPTVGRSEALGTLFVLLAALTPFHVGLAWQPLGLGLLAGALAATHPFGAVELVVLVGLMLAVRLRTRLWLRAWAATVLVALGSFALLLALSPHGLGDSLHGMLSALPYTPWLVPPSLEGWKAWVTERRSTFYGPLVLFSLGCSVRLLALHWRRLGSAVGVVLCATLFLGCVYLGSLTFRSLRNYNLLVLAPLFFGLVLAWSRLRPSPGGRPVYGAAASFVLVLATSVGFFGRLAAWPVYLTEYRTLAQARDAWSRLERPPDRRVAIIGNLWLLGEDYAQMELAPFGSEARLAQRGLTVVLGQRSEHAGVAPERPGLRKLADFFTPPRVARPVLLAPFLEEDYGFAVYLPR